MYRGYVGRLKIKLKLPAKIYPQTGEMKKERGVVAGKRGCVCMHAYACLREIERLQKHTRK
jgi:hypothetical protein